MASNLLSDYLLAWDTWRADMVLAGRMQQASSVTVYEHMWTALSRWCVAQSVALENLTPQRLDDYLASRAGDTELTPRYAWRLLRLVERVLAHRSRRQRARINTAATDLLARRPDIRYANAQDADPPPDSLIPAEARKLVAFLSAIRPRAGTAIASAALPKSVASVWQDARNRAAAALHLGGGVTPAELRVLRLSQLRFNPSRPQAAVCVSGVHIPGGVTAAARDTPLAPWAGLLLGHWLAVREGLAIPGDMVFPSTRTSGKPWGKVAHYEGIKKVLTAAGLASQEGGSYRLRHTFALRQLRRGTPPQQVALWLGVSDPGVMERYQRALGSIADVV